MQHVFFWLLTLSALAGPALGLIWAQRHFKLEGSWYGLTFLGACAAVLTLIIKDVLFRGYRELLPADMTVEALYGSIYGLLFFPLVTGLVIEALKGYGIWLFHTQFTRVYWPLFAASVGAGAGLIEGAHLLTSTAWGVYGEGEALEWARLWLPVRCLANVLFQASLPPITLYFAAENRRYFGWLVASGIHVATLLILQVLTFGAGLVVGWLAPLLFLLGAAGGAGLLWRLAHRRGWPM